MRLVLLLACHDPPGTGDVCPVYVDADRDGFGDPATRRDGPCGQDPGLVTDGTDCDDGDPAVRPGATPICDERSTDDDCDGLVDPPDADGDGDGDTTCAGDCDDADPAVGPEAQEVCNGGLDDDCDGLPDLDDGSADPYTCGWCPDPDEIDDATFETFSLNPCLLDPGGVSGCSTDPDDPDTHTYGLHLHRVVYRTDLATLRPQLLVFLPPGPGDSNDETLRWAALAGYRVLSVGWANEAQATACGGDEPCYSDLRGELAFGEDLSPLVDIPPSDAIVGRLATLLAFLAKEHPLFGWDAYVDAAGAVRWDRVVLWGWSVGAGEAAFIGRDVELHGLVVVSAPKDVVLDASDPDLVRPVSWMAEPRATPACHQVGFYHRDEVFGADPPIIEESLELMGLQGPSVDVDSTPHPFGEAQILTTAASDYTQAWCDPHAAMAMDECMSSSLEQPYLYLFCRAADGIGCP